MGTITHNQQITVHFVLENVQHASNQQYVPLAILNFTTTQLTKTVLNVQSLTVLHVKIALLALHALKDTTLTVQELYVNHVKLESHIVWIVTITHTVKHVN